MHVQSPILGKTTIWFTRHALDRMKQRGVTEKQVFAVLRNPDQKGLPTRPGRRRWRKEGPSGAVVDVVFEVWADRLCIVTAIMVG